MSYNSKTIKNAMQRKNDLTQIIKNGKKLMNFIETLDRTFGDEDKPAKRRTFSKKTKQLVLLVQNHRCNMCGRVLKHADFHHIDGDRSNNNLWNCEALCPNCHAKKTRKRRL